MKYINHKTAEIIESNLTTGEVAEILQRSVEKKYSRFVADMLAAARSNTLTGGRAFWGHKLAQDQLASEQGSENKTNKEDGAFMALFPLFTAAKQNGLKRAKIRFALGGDTFALSLAPETGTNPGHLYYKVNGEYAGKVTPQGAFYPARTCPASAAAHLTEFAANPVGKAKEYGDATGSCCFCGLELTDDRSVTAGYGPVCARKWGLPWGA